LYCTGLLRNLDRSWFADPSAVQITVLYRLQCCCFYPDYFVVMGGIEMPSTRVAISR